MTVRLSAADPRATPPPVAPVCCFCCYLQQKTANAPKRDPPPAELPGPATVMPIMRMWQFYRRSRSPIRDPRTVGQWTMAQRAAGASAGTAVTPAQALRKMGFAPHLPILRADRQGLAVNFASASLPGTGRRVAPLYAIIGRATDSFATCSGRRGRSNCISALPGSRQRRYRRAHNRNASLCAIGRGARRGTCPVAPVTPILSRRF